MLDEPSILDVLEQEERRFARHAAARAAGDLAALDVVDGHELFRLFETYGLPPELTLEELGVPAPGWEEEFSRARDAPRRSRSELGRRLNRPASEATADSSGSTALASLNKARWTPAPISAPTSGATMNSHSCASAHPPTKAPGRCCAPG